MAELRKNIEEERQLQELRQLQAANGNKSAALERVDWMYEGPMGQREKTAEEYLLGKEYSDTALQGDSKYGPPAMTNSALPASDSFSRLNEDPMMLIRKRQQLAQQSVLKNPVKMGKIKAKVDRLLSEKKAKKKAKKEAKKEAKREKKKARREARVRDHSRTKGDSSDDNDSSDEEKRPSQRYHESRGRSRSAPRRIEDRRESRKRSSASPPSRRARDRSWSPPRSRRRSYSRSPSPKRLRVGSRRSRSPTRHPSRSYSPHTHRGRDSHYRSRTPLRTASDRYRDRSERRSDHLRNVVKRDERRKSRSPLPDAFGRDRSKRKSPSPQKKQRSPERSKRPRRGSPRSSAARGHSHDRTESFRERKSVKDEGKYGLLNRDGAVRWHRTMMSSPSANNPFSDSGEMRGYRYDFVGTECQIRGKSP